MKHPYVVAALAGSLLACTTPDPIGFTPHPDSTIDFVPTTMTFERFASSCGPANPPFTPTDLFSLSLLGADTTSARTDIHVSLQRDVPLHQPIDVTLQPFGVTATGTDASGHMTTFYGQYGTLDAGTDTTFGWDQGALVDEVDPGPLASVTVRVDALPMLEGALGIFQLDLTFADGAVLDFKVSQPVRTGFSGCPNG